MIEALMCAVGLWIFYMGMCKWSAMESGRDEPWWLLLWGNLMRIGALFCLIGILYFLGLAIVAFAEQVR